MKTENKIPIWKTILTSKSSLAAYTAIILIIWFSVICVDYKTGEHSSTYLMVIITLFGYLGGNKVVDRVVKKKEKE